MYLLALRRSCVMSTRQKNTLVVCSRRPTPIKLHIHTFFLPLLLQGGGDRKRGNVSTLVQWSTNLRFLRYFRSCCDFVYSDGLLLYHQSGQKGWARRVAAYFCFSHHRCPQMISLVLVFTRLP